MTRPASPRRNASPWGFIVLGVVVLAGLIGGGWYWYATRDLESTDDAFVDGRAITITPQVKGLVTDLAVTDNQFMHARATCCCRSTRATMSPRAIWRAANWRSRRRSARPLSSTWTLPGSPRRKNSCKRGRSPFPPSPPSTSPRPIDRRNHALTPAGGQHARRGTVHGHHTPRRARQTAQAAAAIVQADLVPQLIAQAEAPVAQADAQITEAQADLDQAELNLSYTTMRAPQDGWITKRNVERGDYLQVGASVFSIVAPEVWVTANFKETQLDRMRPGQHVDDRRRRLSVVAAERPCR
jgi:membrane fusion protein (multidrug efflux system)